MKQKTTLIQKTSKTFLITGLILAFLSCVALYFYTNDLLQREIEEELYSTEGRITDAISDHKTLFSLSPITEVTIVDSLKPESLKDTILFDPSQNEMELFRELSTYKRINNVNYHIVIRTLVVETDEIVMAIVLSNIAIFLLAFLFLLYFNKAQNLRLWKPFFYNINQMKQFSVTSTEPLVLVDSDILEFSELQTQIQELTNKVRVDYENLKQFTENISHEIQTPLAIIQAKIDNIINEHAINDKQFEQVSSIQKDIQRLKQLNKKITILTKIDNRQFANVEEVSISQLVNHKVEDYKELEIMNIVHLSNENLVVQIDPFLAEILVTNLISNAIKHSLLNENIVIFTNSNSLLVSNPGEIAIQNPDKLHLRFYREQNNFKSTGLGLSIVQKICDLYGYTLSYKFENKQHIFSIVFGSQS
ncbi:MAG: sensor histidine kinase [Flavobacterium sp.]